jgi:hypothetical protein
LPFASALPIPDSRFSIPGFIIPGFTIPGFIAHPSSSLTSSSWR